MGTATSSTPITATKLTSIPSVDSLLNGYHWDSNNVTFSYIAPGTSVYSKTYQDLTLFNSIQGFSISQQRAATAILQTWSNVTNLTFTQVADGGESAGTIRFSFSNSYDWVNSAGMTYLPSSTPAGGDVWINPKSNEIINGFWNGTLSNSIFSQGSFGYFTLLHEIGHALGLKHPFDNSTNGGGSSIAGTQYSGWDTKVYTAMSYTEVPNMPELLGFTYNPTTPMVLDIAAIQSIYGTNYNYNAGNTDYSFNDIFGQYYFQTIWDGGGSNSITYNGSTSSNIDLRQGHGSKIGNAVYAFTATDPQAYWFNNVWIAYGTKINSFVGIGTANLKIQCNDDSDNITCNSGTVEVYCGTGNDSIICGAGNDLIFLSMGNYFVKGNSIGSSTVSFKGNYKDYSLTKVNGILLAYDNSLGTTSTLDSITYLKFTDQTLSFNTALSAATSKESHTLSLIVDAGILDSNPMILHNLAEIIQYSSNNIITHTITYGATTFNYNDVDSLITTVTRDGNFTTEFQNEIAAVAPSAANITYADAVALVGTANIDKTLIYIAGADGNYVG